MEVTDPNPVQVARFYPANPNAGGKEGAGPLAVGTKGSFAIFVAAPRRSSLAPQLAERTFLHCWSRHRRRSKSVNGLRFGAKAHYCADVQVAVCPTVEPLTDTGRERACRRSSDKTRTECPST